MPGGERRGGGCRGSGNAASAAQFAAIGYGYGEEGTKRTFTAKDWTQDKGLDAYTRSKYLAEKKAWEVAKETGLDLVVINPGFVSGPTVSKEAPVEGTSAELITKVMNSVLPGIPDMSFVWVDVRDVAAAHIRAMLLPEASGRRFLCVHHEQVHLRDIAAALDRAFPAYRVPTLALPTWLVWVASFVDADSAKVLPALGHSIHVDVSDSETSLHVTFRHPSSSAVALAKSLIRSGAVPDKGVPVAEGYEPLDFTPQDLLDVTKQLSN